MTQEDQQRIEALEKDVKTAKSWHSFCGTLGLFAVLLIPLSILFGNRTLGLCAVSWIAGSLFAFVSEAAKSKRGEFENEIYAIKSSGQTGAPSGSDAPRLIEVSFGPISMN